MLWGFRVHTIRKGLQKVYTIRKHTYMWWYRSMDLSSPPGPRSFSSSRHPHCLWFWFFLFINNCNPCTTLKTTDLNKAKCQATPSQQPLPSNLYSVLIPQVSQENMFYFILLNPQLNFNIPSLPLHNLVSNGGNVKKMVCTCFVFYRVCVCVCSKVRVD